MDDPDVYTGQMIGIMNAFNGRFEWFSKHPGFESFNNLREYFKNQQQWLFVKHTTWGPRLRQLLNDKERTWEGDGTWRNQRPIAAFKGIMSSIIEKSEVIYSSQYFDEEKYLSECSTLFMRLNYFFHYIEDIIDENQRILLESLGENVKDHHNTSTVPQNCHLRTRGVVYI